MRKSLTFLVVGAGLILSSYRTEAQTATINLGSTQQYIDGFGASTAWHGAISDDLANFAFSNGNNQQIGLSIIRLRIDPNGSSSWGSELSNAQKAKARGAKIMATPWTPPASMKTNNSTVDGELKTSEYANYASWLNSFRTYMSNGGATPDVISIQNEPNITVTYESCDWTPTQLYNFCLNNAQAIGGNVMMPEAFNFDVNYSDPVLNNSTAASHISHIGGHIYGSQPFYYTNAINKGKRVWMTEHYVEGENITTYMTMAKEILDCMANNMNAYLWWWLAYPNDPTNLINSSGPTKKGYVMAQYSKFVRPGYYRVEATYSPQSGVYVCAFKGTNTVVVIVNQNTSSKSQTITFQNGTVTSVSKRTTSASKNLSDDGTITVSNNSFTTTLDAQSITTFVGSGSCTPTTIVPYIQVNGGSWQQTSSVTVNSGSTVKFGPQPVSGGSWSWTGCGTSGTSREQTITANNSCTATATYTNTSGCQSTQNFNVTVSGNIIVRAKGTSGSETINIQVNGSTVATYTLSTSYQDYSANGSGTVRVVFTNDASGRDVQVDYITIAGATYQAENQATNTGVWQNSQCGGSYSEWLQCNGYIEFSSSYPIVVRARGTNGSETINLTVGGTTVNTWTLTTSYADYSASTSLSGAINVVFTNDATGRDVQVDYVTINGTTNQAENQATNTGVWQNSQCGGSYSEWLHCNGYIGFSAFKSAEELIPIENVIKSEIYPNPAGDILTVNINASQGVIFIYNSMGEVMKSTKLEGQESVIDLSGLSSGLYFIKIEAENQVISKRFIKR